MQRALMPMAVFRAPEVFATRALHPSAVRDAMVQPSTRPATVGVAGDPPPAVTHSKPEAQAELAERTWPFVPTLRAAGVEAAEAYKISPFAVNTEGWSTEHHCMHPDPLEVRA